MANISSLSNEVGHGHRLSHLILIRFDAHGVSGKTLPVYAPRLSKFIVGMPSAFHQGNNLMAAAFRFDPKQHVAGFKVTSRIQIFYPTFCIPHYISLIIICHFFFCFPYKLTEI